MRRLFVIVAGCLASVGAAAAGDRELGGIVSCPGFASPVSRDAPKQALLDSRVM